MRKKNVVLTPVGQKRPHPDAQTGQRRQNNAHPNGPLMVVAGGGFVMEDQDDIKSVCQVRRAI